MHVLVDDIKVVFTPRLGSFKIQTESGIAVLMMQLKDHPWVVVSSADSTGAKEIANTVLGTKYCFFATSSDLPVKPMAIMSHELTGSGFAVCTDCSAEPNTPYVFPEVDEVIPDPPKPAAPAWPPTPTREPYRDADGNLPSPTWVHVKPNRPEHVYSLPPSSPPVSVPRPEGTAALSSDSVKIGEAAAVTFTGSNFFGGGYDIVFTLKSTVETEIGHRVRQRSGQSTGSDTGEMTYTAELEIPEDFPLGEASVVVDVFHNSEPILSLPLPNISVVSNVSYEPTVEIEDVWDAENDPESDYRINVIVRGAEPGFDVAVVLNTFNQDSIGAPVISENATVSVDDSGYGSVEVVGTRMTGSLNYYFKARVVENGNESNQLPHTTFNLPAFVVTQETDPETNIIGFRVVANGVGAWGSTGLTYTVKTSANATESFSSGSATGNADAEGKVDTHIYPEVPRQAGTFYITVSDDRGNTHGPAAFEVVTPLLVRIQAFAPSTTAVAGATGSVNFQAFNFLKGDNVVEFHLYEDGAPVLDAEEAPIVYTATVAPYDNYQEVSGVVDYTLPATLGDGVFTLVAKTSYEGVDDVVIEF